MSVVERSSAEQALSHFYVQRHERPCRGSRSCSWERCYPKIKQAIDPSSRRMAKEKQQQQQQNKRCQVLNKLLYR